LHKQLKDLHLDGQRTRSLPQAPVEEVDEASFRLIVQISWLPRACKLKNDFHWKKELLPD